ncbi:MAG: hypothetical protein Q8O88_05705 [bacterium]|nr:hypothetical protein [bacterium]
MKTTVSYSPELDNIDIFLSPAKVLRRMENIYERYGINQGLKSDSFKQVRECWASAVFLLGYSQITKNQYWLRENPEKNGAPDVFAISIRNPLPNKKGPTREVVEIEVCEYDNHAKTNIVDHIKNKLSGMAYNSHTFLLCYIHVEGQTRLIDIMQGLKDINFTVREIWLLLHLEEENIGNFVTARVYLRGDTELKETNLQFKGNYVELARISQKEMIRTFRGSGQKVDFFEMGIGRVPLPKIKLRK